ncbi:MAG: 2-hydroxychromene-2-carboxylate isomerase [Pseudomonadales bacterium]
MSQPLQIDVFWSFRSPWSYLATPRLVGMAEDYVLDVRFRPVYPIAIRTPDFFTSAPPQWPGYLVRDALRVAEFLGVPYTWPKPDPVQAQLVDGRPDYSVPQPYIHRLTRLGVVAQEQGRGLQFADEVSRMIWGGTENWHEGEHLAQASARAGLDLVAMDAELTAREPELEAAIVANQEAHHACGHWGVPTVAFQGEPFFGQDRLELLLWRLSQHGLQARVSD